MGKWAATPGNPTKWALPARSTSHVRAPGRQEVRHTALTTARHAPQMLIWIPTHDRVRREDLDDSSEGEASGHDEQQDAELLAKLHARMAGMLDLSGIDQAPAVTAADEDAVMAEGPGRDTQHDDAPEEFEFRLFTTTDPATKIALVDEDERALLGDGAMLRGRPLSYYIAGEATPEARAEMAFAAVSGDEVLARARQRWWGMEMPWRVTRVPGAAGKASKTATAAGEEETAAARRRRPGKKKRVALRLRERERKKKDEEQERAKMSKEEALKEKKKRLNRLKKLRKRAKAKEGKKGDDESGSGSGSDGGDE
ncbi:uncharacterized protein LY79DRAFT_589028 [Colletotrichum navitas]|uniref:Uncharacterized protein n=1 Tax=Colletotrichum navitas TaxID=681940 RepID=A0AAD8Q2U8_9PEZI|nr:uncharacterized protein LY79DRAFT_589028 [Colletotrichum navitas]KAK1594886.1 hypothetical protein LY79DRAFT_589028 [Colletotrichum navitas]